MKAQQLSAGVNERLDAALAADAGYQAAEAALYRATAQLERLDRDLFGELDGAWVDVYRALRRVAWLDGYACGRDPDRLVHAPPAPEPEPIAVAWLTVAPGVFLGVQAGDAAASFLAGGAE